MNNFNLLRRFIILAISAIFVISCSVKVEQGNIFLKDNIKKVSLGMTPEQVLYVLGKPTIPNLNKSNEWYYTYSNTKKSGSEVVTKVAIIFFDNKNLVYKIDDNNLYDDE